VYIGSFGANEMINDEGEIIQEDQHGIQASWVGNDFESGITHFMVAVGTSQGHLNTRIRSLCLSISECIYYVIYTCTIYI
jgi:hypothetical protein